MRITLGHQSSVLLVTMAHFGSLCAVVLAPDNPMMPATHTSRTRRRYGCLALLLLALSGCSSGSAQPEDDQDRQSNTTASLESFDTSLDGFALAPSENPANLLVYNDGHIPELTWTTDAGSPSPGALRMSAVYNGDARFVRMEKVQSPSSTWSLPVLRARIQVSGVAVDADHRIVARLFAASSSASVQTQDTVLDPSAEWQTITCRLDVSQSSPPLDLSAVQSYGVELHITAESPGASWPTEQTTALVDSFELVDADVTN